MRCCSVRLLLVAMLATQHTDFESFANALGALPNQPPVPRRMRLWITRDVHVLAISFKIF
jgi:hypothetical protein